MKFDQLYKQKLLQKMKLTILLFGAFMFGIQSLCGNKYLKIAGYVVMFVALLLFNERDFYLPFLGDTVIPSGLFSSSSSPLGADFHITLTNLPSKVRIIYWAAEPKNDDKVTGPSEAYGDYKNAGVTVTDQDGNALVSVRYPQVYKKPYGGLLKPHIHYRYTLTSGMLSRIYTKNIEKETHSS